VPSRCAGHRSSQRCRDALAGPTAVEAGSQFAVLAEHPAGRDDREDEQGEKFPATGAQDPRLADLTSRLTGMAGVARVRTPRVSEDGTLLSVRVEPTTAPSDPATADTELSCVDELFR